MSKVAAEQSGNFFPFYVSAPGKQMELTGPSGAAKTVDVEKDPAERMCAVKLSKGTSSTIKVKMDGQEVLNLTFTSANIIAKG